MELPLIYASNEPKFVLARDLGVAKRQWRLATTETECRGRDNLRNSQSVFHSFVIKMISVYSSASLALSAMTRS